MANPAVQRRSGFQPILLALQAQLISSLGWDASRVILIARPQDKVPHLQADQDVLVRLRGETPEAGIIDAAGRYDDRRERTVLIIMRSRALLDITGQDAVRLTDDTLGLVALEDAVADALETWLPTSATGDIPVARPIRVGTLSDPEFGGDKNRGAGWASSAFTVTIAYERALTQIPYPFSNPAVT